jgi:hypothetical protein
MSTGPWITALLVSRGAHPRRYWLFGGLLVVCSAALLLIAALGFLRKQSPPQPSAEVAELWKQVLAANRAWLDPPVQHLAIHAELLERSYVPAGAAEKWERRLDAQTAVADGRNARLVRRHFTGAGKILTHELRCTNGMGGELKRMPVPPLDRDLRLMNGDWLAARIGMRFWTSMHAVAANSLRRSFPQDVGWLRLTP